MSSKTPNIIFRDPYEMLLFLDDDLIEGRVKLHDWQIQFMIDFAMEQWNKDMPFKSVVRAANGSGKDKYIIAACGLWLPLSFDNAQTVITSSSGTQLDRQTNKYIQQLAHQANAKLGSATFLVNYRHYETPASTPGDMERKTSYIELFVTDEAGRCEGWHPLVPGGKLAIFTSESKSIPDDIFVALSRCTEFTHRVDVSSPGLPMGHFFNICSIAKNRKELDTLVGYNGWIEYHITAYDCSHLSLSYIEDLKQTMPGGESGAAFKSCVLAEFGTTDEMTVIPYQHIWKAINKTEKTIGWLKEEFNTGGLDLSAGGDETVLSIRNGNRLLKVIPFKFDNTQDTVEFLVDKFKEHGLDHPKAYIYADAGGLGKPIIDQLRSKGWTNIRYVLNQAKAFNERVYLNRGAEMWFGFGKLLETGEVWLLADNKLTRQLATRFYKITENNKHKLESKLQARVAGRPSPDRADSVVLCFCHYKSKLDHDYSKIVQTYDEKDIPQLQSDEFKPPFELRKWAAQDNLDTWIEQRRVKRTEDFGFLKKQIQTINKEPKKELINV